MQVLLVLLLSSQAFSQSAYELFGTVGGGFLVPQSPDLKGEVFSSHAYLLTSIKPTLNGKVRLALPAFPLSLTGSISYDALAGDADVEVFVPGGLVHTKYTSSLTIVSLGAGIEESFLISTIVKPYASCGLTLSFMSGSERFDNNAVAEGKLNQSSRLGIDFGIGARIVTPTPLISFDFEAKYRLANLLEKGFTNNGYPHFGYGGIPQGTNYNLNDAKNPLDNNDHTRSINYFTVRAGISFKIF